MATKKNDEKKSNADKSRKRKGASGAAEPTTPGGEITTSAAPPTATAAEVAPDESETGEQDSAPARPLREQILEALRGGEKLSIDNLAVCTSGWTSPEHLASTLRELVAELLIEPIDPEDGNEEEPLYCIVVDRIDSVVSATGTPEPVDEPIAAEPAPVASPPVEWTPEALAAAAVLTIGRVTAAADYVPRFRSLECVLTEDEINAKRAEAGLKNLEANLAEEDMARAKRTLDGAKKRAEVAVAECRGLLDAAARGKEHRDVECVEVIVHAAKRAVTLRTDTLDALDSRALTSRELQGSLFPEQS